MNKDKSKYDFIQWYKLNLDARATLLPVIEGIRHGAFIYIGTKTSNETHALSQRKLLEYCLKRFGLFYKKQGEASYYISSKKEMLEKLWSCQSYIGKFLGYPKCCIEAYNKKMESVTPDNANEKGPAIVFDRKLHKKLRALHINNAECSLYSLFSIFHVPCSVNCKKSLALGERIEKALIKNDPEAAIYLINSNLNSVYYFHFYYPIKNIEK